MLYLLLPYPAKLCTASLYNDGVSGLHFAQISIICSLPFANLADATASPEHPLAQNFKLRDGSVDITVPNLPPRTDYLIVCKFISKMLIISVYIFAVMGDSGNTSPQFAITGSTSTDTPPTSTDSTTAPLSTSTTPSSSTLNSAASSSTSSAASTSGALSLYAPQRSSFKSLSLFVASMTMLIMV